MVSGLHWTYRECLKDSALEQGDIIARTRDIESILENYHSYFLDSKYTSFLVVTQSCDLFQRKSKNCKAEYITLAAVRELTSVLPSLLRKVAPTEIEGIFDASRQHLVQQLLARIINQNEQQHGLFYLHPDGNLRIAVHSVAMLRVTIAVQRIHYAALKAARCGRLEPEFQGKLGWLCGNLFSRVATTDWNEKDKDRQQEIIRELTEAVGGENGQYFVFPEWIDAAKRNTDITNVTKEAAIAIINRNKPPTNLDKALARVEANTRKAIADEEARTILGRLATDKTFQASMTVHLREACERNNADANLIGDDPTFWAKTALPARRWISSYLNPNGEVSEASLREQLGRIRASAAIRVLNQEPLYSSQTIDLVIQATSARVDRSSLIQGIISHLRNDIEFKATFKAAAALILDDD